MVDNNEKVKIKRARLVAVDFCRVESLLSCPEHCAWSLPGSLRVSEKSLSLALHSDSTPVEIG